MTKRVVLFAAIIAGIVLLGWFLVLSFSGKLIEPCAVQPGPSGNQVVRVPDCLFYIHRILFGQKIGFERRSQRRLPHRDDLLGNNSRDCRCAFVLCSIRI